MVDESSDSATQEQMAMYVRCIDLQERGVATKFLQLEQIRGHSDASNICSAIISVIESECYQLPCRKLVGFTTDGASILISPRNGVIALLRQKVGSPKLFSQHCSPHRPVLAAKVAQHHIPDSIEQTVSETLIFLRDSPVRRSEFEDFLEFTDPDNVYCQIAQYH